MIDDSETQIVKAQYRRQLLLYSAMHHDITGCWPVKAHLVPLSGDRISITLDPVEAQKEAMAAIDCWISTMRRSQLREVAMTSGPVTKRVSLLQLQTLLCPLLVGSLP